MNKLLKKRQGFTLIEMTIVLFIISLLILIIIPNVSNARQSAQKVHSNAMVSVVQSQIDAFSDNNPKHQKIDYDTLKANGYLTQKQVDKARNDEKINITKDDKTNTYRATK